MLEFIAAAETDPLKFDPTAYITAVVVFLIAFGVLALKVWPKILGALDARDSTRRRPGSSASSRRPARTPRR
jgi:hypothetical protein